MVADRQVMYPDSMVTGLMVNPISGSYTAEQVLEKMLQGSGLVFEKTGSNMLLLKKQIKSGRQPEKDRARSIEIEEIFVTRFYRAGPRAKIFLITTKPPSINYMQKGKPPPK